MLFHSFYLAIVRMHTKEKMICSFSCHSTSLMSLSTLVEIYTLLCHEAEGELIYDSRNYLCIYTVLTKRVTGQPIYNSRNFICIFTCRHCEQQRQRIYNSRNFICIYTLGDNFLTVYPSTIVEILYVFTPSIRRHARMTHLQ